MVREGGCGSVVSGSGRRARVRGIGAAGQGGVAHSIGADQRRIGGIMRKLPGAQRR